MICAQCGNEISSGKCPFCGYSKQISSLKSNKKFFQVVNIKDDMPTVDIAISRLRKTISDAKVNNIKFIQIIHGYGSSGKGGDINHFIQDELHSMKWTFKIKDYLPGIKIKQNEGISFFKKYPKLKFHNDSKKINKGVTFIVIF